MDCRKGFAHRVHVLSQPICILIAMLVTLSGAWMQWRASWYRMHTEEAMKDRKLSQQQVDQRLRMIRSGGWFLTLAGLAMFVVSLSCVGR
jgi:TRAP-type C4-dicarboxylate transport system permease small subunit